MPQQPNKLLLSVLENLIHQSDENWIRRKNLITALKLEQIDWFTFLEHWRGMDSMEAQSNVVNNSKKAA